MTEKKKITRRDFVKTAAVVGMGTASLGVTGSWTTAAGGSSKKMGQAGRCHRDWLRGDRALSRCCSSGERRISPHFRAGEGIGRMQCHQFRTS